MVNVTSKSNVDFIIRDDFKGYNLKDSHFNLNFSLKSEGDEFELDLEMDFQRGLQRTINNYLMILTI